MLFPLLIMPVIFYLRNARCHIVEQTTRNGLINYFYSGSTEFVVAARTL